LAKGRGRQSLESGIKMARANGVELSYIEAGSGEQDLLMVHGGLSDLRSWGSQMQPFAQRYHVVAYSRRSHYPNPWREYPEDYSVKTERDDLVGLVDALGLREPLHLVGASYGGFACTLVARDFPHVARSLVLSEPPILALLFADAEGAPLYRDFQRKVQQFVVGPYRDGNYEQGLRSYMLNVGGRNLDELPEKTRMIQLQNARTLLAEVLAAEREPFLKEDARKVRTPALLLSGENSIPYLRRTAQLLSTSLSRVEFVTLQKTGHSMHSQNPAYYNSHALDFLGRH